MARTLEELNRTLAELGERQEKRRRLLAQWSVLREEADKRSARAEELKQVLAKERRDVEELEGMSLKGLWLRITGDREVRLSKEEAEALAAQAKYEQALRDVEDAQKRLAEMGRELNRVPDCTAEREAALEEKRALLRAAGGAAGERIAALEEEIAARQSRKKELGEAIAAGREVLSCLNAADGSLGEAENLGTWDMLGGGTFTTMMKHNTLDEARDYVDQAQRALSRFRTELADVDLISRAQVSIGDFATFADYFFDGLFADMAVQEQIEQSRDSVIRAVDEVERVLDQLEDMDCQEDVGIARALDALMQVTEAG